MFVRRKFLVGCLFVFVIERCYKNKYDDKEYEYFWYWLVWFNGKKVSECGILKLKENFCLFLV